jgi:hypothetical protein
MQANGVPLSEPKMKLLARWMQEQFDFRLTPSESAELMQSIESFDDTIQNETENDED